MVARGDLGVEIGDAELPAVQKRLISLARDRNCVVITATQMMQSMIENPMPTRAEVFDVANAVLDGTDAVMLSAESRRSARTRPRWSRPGPHLRRGGEELPALRHRIDTVFGASTRPSPWPRCIPPITSA
jgi:pyruvate kinase